jgi:hypothetical protein
MEVAQAGNLVPTVMVTLRSRGEGTQATYTTSAPSRMQRVVVSFSSAARVFRCRSAMAGSSRLARKDRPMSSERAVSSKCAPSARR